MPHLFSTRAQHPRPPPPISTPSYHTAANFPRSAFVQVNNSVWICTVEHINCGVLWENKSIVAVISKVKTSDEKKCTKMGRKITLLHCPVKSLLNITQLKVDLTFPFKAIRSGEHHNDTALLFGFRAWNWLRLPMDINWGFTRLQHGTAQPKKFATLVYLWIHSSAALRTMLTTWFGEKTETKTMKTLKNETKEKKIYK